MGIQIQGNGGTIAEVDGTTFRSLRVTCKPIEPLGFYKVNTKTGLYTAFAAAAPLFSMRWGDATRLAVIQKIEVAMLTTVAATAAGQAEREFIIARAFTVSDSAGTAIALTGNNQKLRTSYGTSLVTDMRISATAILTAGTRTLDALPFCSAVGWSALNMTGLTLGSAMAGAATGAVWANTGGLYANVFNAVNGQDHPIILAQNEGIIGRIGTSAMATSAQQQTYITLTWAEVTSY